MKTIHFAICLCFVAIVNFGCNKKKETFVKKEKPTVKKTLAVTKSNFPVFYSTTGELKAINKVTLSAEVSGKVIKKTVMVGDTVQKNDLLFDLDKELLVIQKKRLLENLTLQEARIAQAKLQLRRQKSLKDATTPERVEDADLQYTIAQRTMAMLEQDLAEIKVRLKKTQIFAPFAGKIVKLYRNEEELVTSGQSLVILADLSHLKAVVNVPAKVLTSLLEKMYVTTEITNIDVKVTASIFRIYPEANSITKKFPIELWIANKDQKLRAGMFCKARFYMQNLSGVIVPIAFVRTAYSMYFVKVASAKKGPFKERRIKVEAHAGKWLVKVGLQPGEWLQEY